MEGDTQGGRGRLAGVSKKGGAEADERVRHATKKRKKSTTEATGKSKESERWRMKGAGEV